MTSMDRLWLALKELEGFFEQDNLDVEFAFAGDDELYILQVRALCIQGEKAFYSVMTDWNPAEMIGIRLKPLAPKAFLYSRKIQTSRRASHIRGQARSVH